MALQPQALGQLVLELLQLEAEPGVPGGQDLHRQDAGVGGGVQPDGGILAVQILAVGDPRLRLQLQEFKDQLAEGLRL